jgi:hypothetical protein
LAAHGIHTLKDLRKKRKLVFEVGYSGQRVG